MTRRISFISILILMISFCAHAQNEDKRTFTAERFMWYVANYHPVAAQSKLILERGESRVREARGGFDPRLSGDWDFKSFDDKEYFNVLNAGLRIPSWYGLEVQTGFDQSSGRYLNPENNLPAGGLWYTGIKMSVVQGLVIDKRRASLSKAKIFQESTAAEQRSMMNDLYLDALKTYWKWVKAWNSYQIYEESVDLAQTRFRAVKQSYRLGDRPAIDTLEALLQVQNRMLNRNMYQLEYQNATQDLTNYLWFENNTPLELSDSMRAPDYRTLGPSTALENDSIDNWIAAVAETHPELQLYNYKLQSLEVNRRLTAETLKPKLDLKHNVLTQNFGNDIPAAFSDQNYKWGVEFGFPIFLREQRGRLQQAKLDIETTALDRDQKTLQIQNKLRMNVNALRNLEQQIVLFTSAVQNYNNLLQGERQKFSTGESSLFLVNSRETNFILSRLKLTELQTEYKISEAGLVWAVGRLDYGALQP